MFKDLPLFKTTVKNAVSLDKGLFQKAEKYKSNAHHLKSVVAIRSFTAAYILPSDRSTINALLRGVGRENTYTGT